MDAKDKKIATDLCYEIIKEVGRAIRPYVGKPESGEKVKMGADGTPTSYIDVIAEDQVINILKNAPIRSYIISEEIGELKVGYGKKESVVLTQELRRTDLTPEQKPKFIFLIDPIDGTSNAIKEIPAYGISIAVANVPDDRLATLNDVELGFISNFGNGNFFEAEKGKGCWLNNEEVHPSDIVNISDMSLGGFTKSGTKAASKLVDNARRMRVLGSVVLELSYVASGRYDAFLDLRGSRIIDIAASKLIVEEAGGIITNKYGEKLDNKLSIYERTIVVAANLNNGIDVVIERTLARKLEKLKKDPNLKNIINTTTKEHPELKDQLKNLNFNIEFKLLSQSIQDFKSDMAIILGGDGTLLRTQTKMTEEIPIFGINMGTVGFLTEIEVNETFDSLKKILKGEYYLEKRTKLVVSHENHHYSALNEVVVMTDEPSKMLHFQVQVDGEIIES